jgi:small-conductance mechanosensitive channel
MVGRILEYKRHMIESALLEVRFFPWRLRTRVMKAGRLRHAMDYVDPFSADDLTGLVVVFAVWLGIVIAAPLIVLVLAGLLFSVELPLLIALGALFVVARFGRRDSLERRRRERS